MKRLLMLTFIFLSLWAGALAYPSLEDIGDYAVVNNPNPQDRLHLRTGPDASYASLGKYYNGTVCEILDSGEGRSWVKVRIYPTDAQGWMMTSYLAFGESRSSVINRKPTARVENLSGLNLRTGPSGGRTVIDTLANGTQVTVLGVVGEDWCHVQVENLTGYVMTQHLSAFQSPAVPSGQTGVAYVKNTYASQRLNLRARPDLKSAILGRYADGVKVNVIASRGDGWAYVRVGGRTGYMMTQFLTWQSPAASNGQTAYVTNPVAAQKLNLRTGPGASYASYGLFCTGAPVKVLARRSDGWVRVQVGSLVGYMNEDYLSSQYVSPHYPVMQVSNPVATHKLNLRQSPRVQSASLGRYGNGTQISVLGYLAGDEWAYVQAGSLMGYMMLRYLE
ncbi:MAG: SH3 domain-containing protein [Clostridia bacterium]|nr:SH3 domain-containing protein [Clostridia bacterium]